MPAFALTLALSLVPTESLLARPGKSVLVAAASSSPSLISLLGTDDAAMPRIRLSPAVTTPVQASPPPAALLEALRWDRGEALARACDESLSRAEHLLDIATPESRAPEGADILFRSLLGQADRLLLDLKLEATLQQLDAAHALLPCLTRPLETSQVRALFLYEAVARFYQKDARYQACFRDMLAVDPRLFLETDYPPKVQQAFLTAARRTSRLLPAPLNLEGVEGRLFVDGRAGEGLKELSPGRHVVQQQGAAGSMRTVVISVAEAEPGRVPALMRLADKLPGLPSDAEVSERVEALRTAIERSAIEQNTIVQNATVQNGTVQNATIQNALTSAQAELLSRYARQEGRSLLAFVVRSPEGKPIPRFFRPGSGLVQPREDELRALAKAASAGSESSDPGQNSSPTRPDPGDAERPTAVLSTSHEESSRRGPGFMATLGGGAVSWVSSLPTRVQHPQDVALSLQLGWRGEQVEGRVRLGLGLLTAGQPGAQDCGSFSGDAETPTEQELDAALACLPSGRAFQLGLGLGYPVTLTSHLTLTPAFSANVMRVPQVLVTSGDASSWQVHDALTLGPELSARLSWLLNALGSAGEGDGFSPTFGLYIEPSVGLQLANLDGSLLLGVPLAFTLGGEVAF